MPDRQPTPPSHQAPAQVCGLIRRLAAILYDSVLLGAVLFIAAALVIVPLGLGLGIEVRGEHPLFRLYVLAVTAVYYCGFWVWGGQTLGMRSWRIRLTGDGGEAVSLRQALLRFGAAWVSSLCLGLGFLAALIDPEKKTWHDRWSRTRLIVEQKSR